MTRLSRMRHFLNVFVFWGLLLVSVTAQIPLAVEEFGGELPLCAQSCISPVLNKLGFNNATSTGLAPLLCHDIPAMVDISGCLQTDCSYADHVKAWPFQRELCQGEPSESRAGYIRTLTIAMALIASVFVLLRCYSRISVVQQFWWDDWDMLIAAIFMVTIAALMIWDSTIGLGNHAWEIEPGDIVAIAKIFFVMKLFYVLVQILLKVSILLFFLRTLPVEWIQYTTWAMIIITLAHGVAFFFAILFQCTPIPLLWDKRLDGKCIDLRDIIIPGAILSIVEDVAILVLPIPCLSTLNVGKGKRISLIAVFSVGFVATLTSMIRVKPVWEYSDTLNQAWDTIDLLAWSEIELTTATICVCLPSLNPILNKHFPRYFGSVASFNSLDSPRKQSKASAENVKCFGNFNKVDFQPGMHHLENKMTVTPFACPERAKRKNIGLDSVDLEIAGGVGARELEIYRADEFEVASELASPTSPKRISRPPLLPALKFLRDREDESWNNQY